MSTKFFVLKITPTERGILMRSMDAMRNEYEYIISQLHSQYLANGFRDDVVEFNRLIQRLVSLATREELNAKVAEELRAGNKINAIKAVREVTMMDLKTAKEYVDNFDFTEGYGTGKV